MRILKFGGSSLATVGRIREVDRIVLKEARRELIVVVSAFQGVTNELLGCARLAEKRDRSY
jgi:aspartokinase/homoserine dehydrogenase 1